MASIKETILQGYRPGMKLSPREIEIITLVALGYTDKDIAGILKRSARTVQTHITRIGLKLQAANRTHAACLFIVSQSIEKLQALGFLAREEA